MHACKPLLEKYLAIIITYLNYACYENMKSKNDNIYHAFTQFVFLLVIFSLI